MDLKYYLSLFLRRIRWFALATVVACVAAVSVSFLLPSKYEAVSRLVVKGEQIPDDLAMSTVQTDGQEQMEIIRQRIMARETLLDMAKRLNVYAADPKMTNPDDIVADMRKRITIATELPPVTSRQRAGLTTLVSVSFEAGTPSLAAQVTNDIVTMILAEDTEMRVTLARQTLDFFDQEVSRLEQALSGSSAAILAFKTEHGEALPENRGPMQARLTTLQGRVADVQAQLAAALDQRDRLRRRYERSSDADLPVAELTPEARELRQSRQELMSQLAVYSEENPRIRVLKARIASLETVVDEQRSSGDGTDTDALSAFDLQVMDLDADIELTQDQLQRLELQTAEVQRNLVLSTANETQLAALERDYENIQTQYNRAVASQAAAATGDLIETLARGQRVTVIEQAAPPTNPTSPNRPAIAIGGTVAGMLVGLAIVVLLELMSKAIRRPNDLVNGLGVTPFATISYHYTPAQSVRRRGASLLVTGAVVGAIALILWGLDTYYRPLDQIYALTAAKISQYIR